MSEERVFRQTLTDEQGNLVYGPEEVIDAGPFKGPGIGSFVQLEDGWYRLRRKGPEDMGWPEPHPLPSDYGETAE